MTADERKRTLQLIFTETRATCVDEKLVVTVNS